MGVESRDGEEENEVQSLGVCVCVAYTHPHAKIKNLLIQKIFAIYSTYTMVSF